MLLLSTILHLIWSLVEEGASGWLLSINNYLIFIFFIWGGGGGGGGVVYEIKKNPEINLFYLYRVI